QMVGMVLCLWAPRQHGARLLAGLALLFTLGGFVFSGVVSILEGKPAPWRGNPVLRSAAGGGGSIAPFGMISNASGLLFFLSYLRAVARHIRDLTLIRSTRLPLILFGVIVAWIVGVLGIMLLAGPSKDPPAAIIAVGGCGLWTLGAAFFIAFLIALK